METQKGSLLVQFEYKLCVYWPLSRVMQNPMYSVSSSTQIMIWKTRLLLKFSHFLWHLEQTPASLTSPKTT